MAKEISYYHISQFLEYKNLLIKNKKSFVLIETQYTRRIDIPDEDLCLIFNETGKQDIKLLGLINRVRKDANYYMAIRPYIKEKYIGFYDIWEIPDSDEIICKVDIRAAYWTYACMKDILSEETHNFFLDNYTNSNYEESKKARLKALGALATRKRRTIFTDGIEDENQPEPEDQPTKALYLDICRGIDNLMVQCYDNVDGVISYYWDCIFIRKKFAPIAIEFFKSQKYDVTVEETHLRYIEIGQNGYLLSVSDSKIYMVSKENSKLFKYLKLV